MPPTTPATTTRRAFLSVEFFMLSPYGARELRSRFYTPTATFPLVPPKIRLRHHVEHLPHRRSSARPFPFLREHDWKTSPTPDAQESHRSKAEITITDSRFDSY